MDEKLRYAACPICSEKNFDWWQLADGSLQNVWLAKDKTPISRLKNKNRKALIARHCLACGNTILFSEITSIETVVKLRNRRAVRALIMLVIGVIAVVSAIGLPGPILGIGTSPITLPLFITGAGLIVASFFGLMFLE